MDIIERYFLSSTDQWKIYYYFMLPKDNMKAIIQISHGMYEKAIRYEELMNFLCKNGYGVYVADHRGHGKSTSHGLGNLGKGDGYLKMIRDMRALHLIIRNTFPNHKVFLIGHSLGAFLSQRYIQMYPNTVDGIVQLGCGGRDQIANAKLGMNMANSLRAVGLGNKKANSLFWAQQVVLNHKIKKKRTPFDWICSNEEVIKEYRQDQGIGFCYTASSYYSIFKGISETFQRSSMRLLDASLPICLLSGTEDPIGNFGKGVYALSRWYGTVGMNNITCKTYLGKRHELLHETNKQEVMQDILQWLDVVRR